ncbi:MAG: HDOD domain-containing protein [Planctomycetaceae bacterium]|nr:HDOD domain-containing protein [Planctomycetaceae bacterium]
MIDWTALRVRLLGERNTSVLPSTVRLPALPQAVTDFVRKSQDPEASPAQLGRIIESDAGLTTNLLKLINSAAFALRMKVSTPQQAISLLGVKKCRLFLLTTSAQQAMSGIRSTLINPRSFWAVNLERGLFAQEVAGLLKADSDLAYAAGILQDLVLPVLTGELTEEYTGFLNAQGSRNENLNRQERSRFGWDHCDASGQLMLGWEFPDDLICCIQLHHRGLALLGDQELQRTAATAVAISALLPDPLQQVPDGVRKLALLGQSWKTFDLMELAERVDTKMLEFSSSPSGHIPLSRRCSALLKRAEAVAAPAS